MNIILKESHIIAEGSKGRAFDITVEGGTAVENEPPYIRLKVNDSVFEAPLMIIKEIIELLQTAEYAIKKHSLGQGEPK